MFIARDRYNNLHSFRSAMSLRATTFWWSIDRKVIDEERNNFPAHNLSCQYL